MISIYMWRVTSIYMWIMVISINYVDNGYINIYVDNPLPVLFIDEPLVRSHKINSLVLFGHN